MLDGSSFTEAQKCHEAGDLAEAERLYEKALNENPDNAEAWYFLGFLDIQRKRPESALQRMDRAVAIRPDFSEVHLNRGSILAELGRDKEAVAAWQTALRQDPTFTMAHKNIAILLRKLGRDGDAVPHLLANAEATRDAELFLQAGQLAAKENQVPISREAAEDAVAIKPRLVGAHLLRSSQACLMGRLTEAEHAARMAIEIDAGGAAGFAALGHVLLTAERRPAAAEAFAKAVELEPASVDYRHYRALAAGVDDADARNRHTRRIFDACANTFDDILVNALGYDMPRTIAEELRQAGALAEPARIVDLGCGTGLCGLELSANAAYLAGVDLSPKMVEQTQARGVYDEVAAAEINDYLVTRAAAFDIAIAADVLVYVGDSALTFSAIYNALTSGGWFVFSIEESDQPGFRAQQSGRFVHHPDYIRKLAQQTRFTIVKEHRTILRKERGNNVTGIIFIARAR